MLTKELDLSSLNEEVLEKTIQQALQKISSKNEKDLCRYLPATKGSGYLHHFSLNKLKKRHPAALMSLLKEFIINPSQPNVLKPKQRAPKGSRKKSDRITFNRDELTNLVELARKAGYRDIVAKLSPQRSLVAIKRDLIRTIKANTIDHELWELYVEGIGAAKN